MVFNLSILAQTRSLTLHIHLPPSNEMTLKRVFDNIVERDRVWQCQLCRINFWQRRKRDKKNFDKQCDWYKNGAHATVTFVEATPNRQLAKEYRKALNELCLKICIIQWAGKSLKKMITKSDPFNEGKCNQNKWKICKLDSSTKCKGRGVVYQIKCQWCTGSSTNNGPYVGETASTGEELANI